MLNLKKLIVLIFITVLVLILLDNNFSPVNSQKVTVQFTSWGSQSEICILKPILAQFEKENPDIKVDFVHIPQNYFQKLHLLFASNLAPDVIFINNLYLPIYAHGGMLEELGEQKTANGKGVEKETNPSTLQPFDLSTFYSKSLEALSYQGKLYAIPRDISTLVIYYNKDLFEEYNVPCPNRFWSFEDFLTLAQKMTRDTNNDGKPDVWGISFEEDLLFYLPYLMSEGGGVLSDDLKTSIFNAPESQKGLEFYADLRNKYNVAPTKSQSASETMAQLFLQEKLAMHLSGRWLVPKYRSDANFNWNVINFPKGDKGNVVPLDSSGWAIAKNSKHKKEAMRLIKFLSSKESIEKFAKSGLIVPARIDVAESDIFLDKHNSPHNPKVFLETIKTSKPTPVSINYNEVQDEIKEKTNCLFNRTPD